jgi:hypothetical protein
MEFSKKVNLSVAFLIIFANFAVSEAFILGVFDQDSFVELTNEE